MVNLDVRLTVLGSLNMDISVAVTALPKPGETVLGGGADFAPGGKGANQAVAAARLGSGAGVAVRMVGCVGDDDFGRALRAALTAAGVGDEAVRTVPGAPTGIAMITVDQAGENIITVAPGANREVGPAETAAAVGDVLVISAEIPVVAIRAALAPPGTEPLDRSRAGRPTGPRPAGSRPLTVLNLAPAPPEAAELVAAAPDWLVVNESEAAAVLGRPVSGLADAAAAAADLVAAGARHAVVTAGAAGAAYHGPAAGATYLGSAAGATYLGSAAGATYLGSAGGATFHGSAGGAVDGPGQAADGRPADPDATPAQAGPAAQTVPVARTVPAFPVHAVDTVGAGDTFVGALAVALAAGLAPGEAVTAAAAAGAAAAARPGTQAGMPRPADVAALTGYAWPLPQDRSRN